MRAGLNQCKEALAQPALCLCLIESHSELQELGRCAESKARKNTERQNASLTDIHCVSNRVWMKAQINRGITEWKDALWIRWPIVDSAVALMSPITHNSKAPEKLEETQSTCINNLVTNILQSMTIYTRCMLVILCQASRYYSNFPACFCFAVLWLFAFSVVFIS